MTKPSIIAALVATAAFAAGCGGGYGDQSSPTKPAAAASAATTVELTGSTFKPAAVDVKAGETVTFVNKDAIAHNATGEGLDSGTMAAGATFDFVAETAGTISYVCTFHPGMTGTINVT